jgi:hypothetical protein
MKKKYSIIICYLVDENGRGYKKDYAQTEIETEDILDSLAKVFMKLGISDRHVVSINLIEI